MVCGRPMWTWLVDAVRELEAMEPAEKLALVGQHDGVVGACLRGLAACSGYARSGCGCRAARDE